MKRLLLKKCDNGGLPNLNQDYSIITIVSEDESQQAKLRTPEHLGQTYELEELLQQLEGDAQHFYDPDRIIPTPHLSEMQSSPPAAPATHPLPAAPTALPPVQLAVERYQAGRKDMGRMAEVYGNQAEGCCGSPSPSTPQEWADRSMAWLQKMETDHQVQLHATRSNIEQLQKDLEAARAQELKVMDNLVRIQEYQNLLQQKW